MHILPMKYLCRILVLVVILILPETGQAQITFSQKTAETESLEARVNQCTEKQTISLCLGALSRTHVLQLSHNNTPDTADTLMRNAVMLLPLYVLAELYNHEDREDLSCGFAQSGDRQLNILLQDIDTLMARDPDAFKNIETTKSGLVDIGARFDKVLAQCG